MQVRKRSYQIIITRELIFGISKNKLQTYQKILNMVKRLPEIVNVGVKKRLVPLKLTLSSSLIDSDTQRRWYPRFFITIESIQPKRKRNISPKVVVPLTTCPITQKPHAVSAPHTT